MRIAMIGAGNVGSALAKSLDRAGHDVVLTSRSLGPGVAEAALGCDLAVLAVPFASAAEEVCRELGQAIGGKVLIDATNPLNDSYSDLVTVGGPSAAERIQRWLPGAIVVKAFNTIFAANMALPVAGGEPVDCLVAASDETAAESVLALAGEMGFRPIYVGLLQRARELEAMAFLNITMQATFGGAWRSAWKLEQPPAQVVRETSAAAREAIDELMARQRSEAGRTS